MIGRSPTIWYATITVDKGRSSGVRVDQPVVNGDGLVGKVTAVTGGASQISCSPITQRVSAACSPRRTDAGSGDHGHRPAGRGAPAGSAARVRAGGEAKIPRVTPWSRPARQSSKLESLFPANIPIGTVSKVDDTEQSQYQRVHMRPFADLRRLDFVQVLTRNGAGGGNERASATP